MGPLRSALRAIHAQTQEAYLFGGILRDVMLGGRIRPRDIDVVVDRASLLQLEQYFRQAIRRKTRFGGLVMNVSGWRLDVWALEDTWAFRTHQVPGTSFEALPATTFLNIEAVATEIHTTPGRSRRVAEGGFFRAIEDRTLEINLEPNPFPYLAVVRALLLAASLNFGIGPRLLRYIVSTTSGRPLDHFLEAQRSHYGHLRRHQRELVRWIISLHEQHRADPSSVASLPHPSGSQLPLIDTNNWQALAHAEPLARLEPRERLPDQEPVPDRPYS